MNASHGQQPMQDTTTSPLQTFNSSFTLAVQHQGKHVTTEVDADLHAVPW